LKPAPGLLVDTAFDPVRDEPDVQKLLAKVGLDAPG
jgi:hypothetical protein